MNSLIFCSGVIHLLIWSTDDVINYRQMKKRYNFMRFFSKPPKNLWDVNLSQWNKTRAHTLSKVKAPKKLLFVSIFIKCIFKSVSSNVTSKSVFTFFEQQVSQKAFTKASFKSVYQKASKFFWNKIVSQKLFSRKGPSKVFIRKPLLILILRWLI